MNVQSVQTFEYEKNPLICEALSIDYYQFVLTHNIANVVAIKYKVNIEEPLRRFLIYLIKQPASEKTNSLSVLKYVNLDTMSLKQFSSDLIKLIKTRKVLNEVRTIVVREINQFLFSEFNKLDLRCNYSAIVTKSDKFIVTKDNDEIFTTDYNNIEYFFTIDPTYALLCLFRYRILYMHGFKFEKIQTNNKLSVIDGLFPMNMYEKSYTSLFYDTDHKFGSKGPYKESDVECNIISPYIVS